MQLQENRAANFFIWAVMYIFKLNKIVNTLYQSIFLDQSKLDLKSVSPGQVQGHS